MSSVVGSDGVIGNDTEQPLSGLAAVEAHCQPHQHFMITRTGVALANAGLGQLSNGA